MSKPIKTAFISFGKWLKWKKTHKIFLQLREANYEKKIVKELKVDNSVTLTSLEGIDKKKIEEHFSKMLTSKIMENGTVNDQNFD